MPLPPSSPAPAAARPGEMLVRSSRAYPTPPGLTWDSTPNAGAPSGHWKGHLDRTQRWTHTSETVGQVGYLQVVAGGRTGSRTDITWWRGAHVIVQTLTETDPFGHADASIIVPALTGFEFPNDPDDSTLAWLYDMSPISVYLVSPDGSTVTSIYEGAIAVIVDDTGTGGTTLNCIGSLYQLDDLLALPSFVIDPVDIGTAIHAQLVAGGAAYMQFSPAAAVTTGIQTRQQGSWNGRLTGFVQDVLGTYGQASDGTQWTLMCPTPRQPQLVTRDMTTVSWTVSFGTPGVTCSLQRDAGQGYKAIYGSGQAPDGCSWRNSKYPTTDPPWIAPLASMPQVEPNSYDANGNITGTVSAFDPNVPRVEKYEAFGDRVSKADAVASATAELTVGTAYDPGWVGTITLTADPEEGSRFSIRAGQNLKLRYHRGLDRVCHVASRQLDLTTSPPSVTLTVDTRARSLMTVQAVISRDRDTADPANQPKVTRRQSQQVDPVVVFDCESGAGVVPSTSVPAHGWAVVRVPFGERGSIAEAILQTTPSARFSAVLFDTAITATTIAGILPNPLQVNDDTHNPYDDAADTLDAHGYFWAVGGPGQAAGYYPNTDPGDGSDTGLTGKMLDAGGFAFDSTSPPYVYLAVYADRSTTVTGTFKAAPPP